MPGMANRWVRRRGEAIAEWHTIPPGAKSPRGVVLAACGTSLGDDADNLEHHDETLLGGRCAACQGIVLRCG